MLIKAAFQTVMENTKDMVFVKNKDLVYMAASKPFVKMVGKEKAEDIIGHYDFLYHDVINYGKFYKAKRKSDLDESALEKMGVTIIFLFNYQKKYSKIYSSWHDIYGIDCYSNTIRRADGIYASLIATRRRKSQLLQLPRG